MNELREHLVHGPPGTGKTGYLSVQAPRAAAKYGAAGVAIVSLTRSAAETIAARVPGLPDENVGTLHAFAYRALDRPPLAETPEGLALWNAHCDAHSPNLKILKAAHNPDADAPLEMAGASTDGEKLLEDLQTRRARMEEPDAWPARLQHFHELWTEWKADVGRIDFTDMIEQLLTADPRPEQPDDDEWTADVTGPGYRGRFPGSPAVVMIDEAQDLSRLEMALIRRFAEHLQQVVIVGDSFQNLYQWRGSEPEVFAGGQYASEIVLGQSWRVPATVLDYARAWVTDRIDLPFPEYRPRPADPEDPDGPAAQGRVLHLPCRYRAPSPLIRAVNNDLRRTVIEKVRDPETLTWIERQRPAEVMVLATCRYMLDAVARGLREAGIPFHNPYQETQGSWNPMRGARRLAAFLRPDGGVWPGENRLWTWQDLVDWSEPLTAKGVFKRGGKTFAESMLIEDRFGESQADETVPLETLLQLLTREAADRATSMDVDWWAENLRAKRRQQFLYALEVLRTRGKLALRETPRVVLGTIHSVKGAEADCVYVFPDLSHAAYWGSWSLPSTRGSVVRQFYVAFTRARHTLTLLDPSGAEYAQLPNPRAQGGPAPCPEPTTSTAPEVPATSPPPRALATDPTLIGLTS